MDQGGRSSRRRLLAIVIMAVITLALVVALSALATSAGLAATLAPRP